MKPQFQKSHISKSFREETQSRGLGSPLPALDYDYLGTAGEFRARGSRYKLAAPPFYKLGNDFIGSENKRHYLEEAAYFAIIVAVSTWPIVSMVRAVAELVK